MHISSSGGQRYTQVWPWLVVAPAHRATLARCTWAIGIQAERHDVQLHARPSSSVPNGFLPSDLQRRITVTTSIYRPTTRDRSTLPTKHHRPTGFLCGSSVGVEFFARLPAWFWCWQSHIQTTFEIVYICFALAHTAY